MVRLESHGNVVLEVELGLGVIGLGLEVNNEIILDSENGVYVEMRVVARVDLVDDSGVVGVGNHEMDVGGAHGGAVHEVEEDSSRAIGRERVRGWVVTVPEELSLFV